MWKNFIDWFSYLPFTIPSVIIWWIIWTSLDAYYGGKLMGIVRGFKRRIRGYKKPGRKAQSEQIRLLNQTIKSLKNQIKDKKTLVTQVKKAVEEAQKKGG